MFAVVFVGGRGFIDWLGCASGLRKRMNGEAPPRYSLAVGSIGVPEAGFERTLLIQDDEHVEGGKHGDRVLEKVKTEEKPRLAEE